MRKLTMKSDVYSESVLELRIYSQHDLSSDKRIGKSRAEIGVLLKEGVSGGKHAFDEIRLHTNVLISYYSAINRNLCTSDSDNDSLSTLPIAVEFSIRTINQADTIAAMNRAVVQGSFAFDQMKPVWRHLHLPNIQLT